MSKKSLNQKNSIPLYLSVSPSVSGATYGAYTIEGIVELFESNDAITGDSPENLAENIKKSLGNDSEDGPFDELQYDVYELRKVATYGVSRPASPISVRKIS